MRPDKPTPALPADPVPGAGVNKVPLVKMKREGDPDGVDYPTVSFDPAKRCQFHLNALGERVNHGVPEGFHFDPHGKLIPKGVSDGD